VAAFAKRFNCLVPKVEIACVLAALSRTQLAHDFDGLLLVAHSWILTFESRIHSRDVWQRPVRPGKVQHLPLGIRDGDPTSLCLSGDLAGHELYCLSACGEP
jgi:hypothetical protein